MNPEDRFNKSQHMKKIIETYFEGCNEADLQKIINCFTVNAIHYFPPDMYDGPWRGAEKIAKGWQSAVENLGSYWTIDRVMVDPDTDQAAMEWTHFKTKKGVVLRGAEWYFFDKKSGLISEIRAYYASPQDPSLKRLELRGMDYEAIGYSTAPPKRDRK